MKSLIFFIVTFLSVNTLANNRIEILKTNVFLCMGTKNEYAQCKKSGLSKCQKKNRVRYYQQLQCPKLLSGLEIDQWNDKIKKKKYEWAETCSSVKKEYQYCSKEGLSKCVKSMIDRYKYLWCNMVLEEELNQ